VIVFTVNGRHIAEALRAGPNWTRLNPEQVEDMLRDYDENGFGHQGTHGLATSAWVCGRLAETTPNLDLLLYHEGAWLGRDVVACKKRPG
jgi:hypothetical protein